MLPEPFNDFEVYATLAAAEAGVTAMGASSQDVRAVRCNTAGTLVVSKSGGATAALPFLAGETQHINIRGIVQAGSSGCVPITVFR
jgi:hypothetical protein